jgi:hypothetical protein
MDTLSFAGLCGFQRQFKDSLAFTSAAPTKAPIQPTMKRRVAAMEKFGAHLPGQGSNGMAAVLRLVLVVQSTPTRMVSIQRNSPRQADDSSHTLGKCEADGQRMQKKGSSRNCEPASNAHSSSKLMSL